MKYKELIKVQKLLQQTDVFYGQPINIEDKYRSTYEVVGKLLNKYPDIYSSLRASALGSTNSIKSLLSICNTIDNRDFFNLDYYYLFEQGRGRASVTLEHIIKYQLPVFRENYVPIQLVKENIYSFKHRDWIGLKGINFLDLDTCSSLFGAAGLKTINNVIKISNMVLAQESIVSFNFVVKSFRVKSNYEEFNDRLSFLIKKLENTFVIQDELFTQYESVKARKLKTHMGGVILKLKRKNLC